MGRERELYEVVDALAQSRLITLTGPGGTGKTRLALAAAEAAGAPRHRTGAVDSQLVGNQAVGRGELR